MGVVLRALTRPWRMVRKLRVMVNTVVTSRRQLVQLQMATNSEVRELHQSSLMAAIQVIEEQRLSREALARDYARLERRLEALERRLAAPPPPAAGA